MARLWKQIPEGRWKADTASAISGTYSLHHFFDNTESGTDRIGIKVENLYPTKDTTRWTFLIRHGYDPSSSNNWSVFLMSDSEPADVSANGSTNGFALGVNLTGFDDTLRLIKVKGQALTTVVNCGINWQTGIGASQPVKIVVERSPEGNWNVKVLNTDNSLLTSANGSDSELFPVRWFCIMYKYTSTRDRLLWLDDLSIEGYFYKDREAPVVNSCVVTGRNRLELSLNEKPSGDFLLPENFYSNTAENIPVSVIMKNDLSYSIEFINPFIIKSLNDLIINNICDESGNCSGTVTLQFTPVWAETGDVIISEIMAKPVPEVSLPGKEYIELTNRTGFPFNLRNWKLSTEDQDFLFPDSIIGPGEIRIICSAKDTSLFKGFGKVTGLRQFPTLTDEGRLIWLSDSLGNMIHGVEYSKEWYGDKLKSDGGWSLEMIDKGFPFYDSGNWKASISKTGGTPGLPNSVSGSNPDPVFIGVKNVFAEDSINIRVMFSEPVLGLSYVNGEITLENNEVNKVIPSDPLYREFLIKPLNPLKKGLVYSLNFSLNIKDFSGNIIEETSFSFGLAEMSEKGDIKFNELLFNPLPGDPDYVELYNCSGKTIDASRLMLATLDNGTGVHSQLYPVSDEKRCILPGTYYAITPDTKKIADRYFSGDKRFLFETGSLPSLPDDEGHLILYNRELDKIDEVTYSENMHYSLLSSYEGVSLEKINPDLNSEEAGNWHSAAESSGWGTPGAKNSVYSKLPVSSDKIIFSSSKITPDNDGNDDVLVINFNLTGIGNVISVSVFDETGNFVRKIAATLLVGTEASLSWDGTADDGALVSSGIYIVFITMYNDTGKTEKWKKVCAVIRK
jgi:hypothetical protein